MSIQINPTEPNTNDPSPAASFECPRCGQIFDMLEPRAGVNAARSLIGHPCPEITPDTLANPERAKWNALRAKLLKSPGFVSVPR